MSSHYGTNFGQVHFHLGKLKMRLLVRMGKLNWNFELYTEFYATTENKSAIRKTRQVESGLRTPICRSYYDREGAREGVWVGGGGGVSFFEKKLSIPLFTWYFLIPWVIENSKLMQFAYFHVTFSIYLLVLLQHFI